MALVYDVSRSILIYSHLLFFGTAISTVLWSDIHIMKGELDSVALKTVGRITTYLFMGLWITGLLITYMDTGFDPVVLAQKSKLLMKFTVVISLSINGLVLHYICFSILSDESLLSNSNAIILSICGALSTSHWLLAAFVGSATMLADFSYTALFIVYCGICLFILLTAMLISPKIQRQFNSHRSHRPQRHIDIELS